MKATKLLILLTFILTGLTFSSCSDDDENEKTINTFGPKNVFTGDLPKTVGISSVKYNTEGLVEEMSNLYYKITFEYQTKLKSANDTKSVLMTVNDLEDPENSYTAVFEIGENGFASKALETYVDKTTDTWEFKYNNDGQLNYMKRSEGDNEITTITYTDGNITGIKMVSDDKNEGTYSASIAYTSEVHSKGIENKGCIMLFDITFGIDMDEMEIAYYAGLLGRATKNLPLTMTQTYTYSDEPSSSNTYNFDWTLNAKGYPVKVNFEDEEDMDFIEFAW